MKTCPKCHANAEGLVFRCDCCGSLLEHNKDLFSCAIFELPQCLGFSNLIYEMVDAIQPPNPDKYNSFLNEIGISMICYPDWMLEEGNIKSRLYYSAQKKYASLRIIVNYNEFVYSDKIGKANLVAAALLQGIHSLQTRLNKSKLDINDIVTKAEVILDKYIF